MDLVYLQQIEEAKSARELCSLIYRFSGFRLLPEVVFHKNGGLRSFKELKKRALEQLTQTVNRPNSTLNEVSTDFLGILGSRPVPVHTPARTALQRRRYMQLGLHYARLYVDKNGYPL